MSYIPTIGLEIHAELKTKTKMFCDCLNDPREAHPNTNICPVCTGQPGTLPTVNKRAIELMIMVGMALNGKVADRTKFDRKNYFYPDLPKGYQISQYDEPIISGGRLLGVRITRVHLEEDAGSNAHEKDSSGKEVTLVDYNRAGRPLMELVTEPDIKDAKQAREFAEELQRILRYLGASYADMDKGQMRVEANISVRKNESDPLGTKVEVKNLNSFRSVEDAINYELARQEELINGGGKVIQETRGWDENKKKTVSQRLKEGAHDYRYFPEPDLPPMELVKSGIDMEKLRVAIPELPEDKRKRFMEEFGLDAAQVEVLVQDRAMAEYFEEAVSELKAEEGSKHDPQKVKLLLNYFTSDFWGILSESEVELIDCKITPENFADLILLISSGKVTSRVAKDILKKMFDTGLDPNAILKSEGLEQVSDEAALGVIASEIIAENAKAVEDYKKGKIAALQALIGKAMAKIKGKANPVILGEVFRKLIDKV